MAFDLSSLLDSTMSGGEEGSVVPGLGTAAGAMSGAMSSILSGLLAGAFSNSWEETYNKLKSLSPSERLQYYMTKCTQNRSKTDLNQYSELFGARAEAQGRNFSDDYASLTYAEKKAYNDLCEQLGNPESKFPDSQMGSPAAATNMLTGLFGNSSPSNSSASGISGLFTLKNIAIGLAAIFLLKKFFK